jgi:hypothetical protein
MAQTVVGFFDDAQDARRAVEQLVSNGFDRSRIDVSSGNSSTGMGTASTSTETFLVITTTKLIVIPGWA